MPTSDSEAAARLERACAVLDELIAIQLAQGSTNFLPGFRLIRGRAAASPDPAEALAAMWETYRPTLSGGMGSVNDLVFWPDDVVERVAVNNRWQSLRTELYRLLEPTA